MRGIPYPVNPSMNIRREIASAYDWRIPANATVSLRCRGRADHGAYTSDHLYPRLRYAFHFARFDATRCRPVAGRVCVGRPRVAHGTRRVVSRRARVGDP